MAVHLLMTLAAIHGFAAGGMLVTVVLDPLMAVLTRKRLAAMHGSLEFLDRDVESTPIPTLCVTGNTLLRRIGLGEMIPWGR
jgi:hypothetical protein